MATKILAIDNLQVWLDKLAAKHRVFAPVEADEGLSKPTDARFERIKSGQKPVLDKRTVVSPKGVLFKQVEKLLSYERDGSDVKINESMTGGCYCAPVNDTATSDNSKQNDISLTVLLGVRPCDARSFMLTDKPFVHSDMPETAYSKRREHSAIITYACDNATKTCFCTTTGGSPVEKTGDIWMMKLEDGYLVEALTPRGEELLAFGEGLFADATSDDQAKAKDIGDKVITSMEVMRVSSTEGLDKLFKDEGFWKELTEKCLSCGACTFVCPTCYCFDVRDEGSVSSGDRYRRWDSCMFFQYNRAAGGHNPRDMHWKRMRQRMLHKFCYFVEKYGDIDCVGCGRCIRSCPVSYDIRDFIKKSFTATGGLESALEGDLETGTVSTAGTVEQASVEQVSEASAQAAAAIGIVSAETPRASADNADSIDVEAQVESIDESTSDGFAAALPSENDEPFICDVKIDVGQNIDSSETSKLDMKEPVTQNPVIENLVEESSIGPVDVFQQKPTEVASIFSNNYDFDEGETVDEPVLVDEKALHGNENKVTGEGSDV